MRSAVLLVLALLASCASEPPVTTPEGSVRQRTWSLAGRWDYPVDLVITALPPRDDAGRATLERSALDVANELSRRLLETPRAYDHGSAADLTVRIAVGPDVETRSWRETPATRAGAEAFAAEVGRVLAARFALAGDDAFAGARGAITAARGRHRPYVGSLQVLVLAAADVPPGEEVADALARRGFEDQAALVFPRRDADSCFGELPALEAWAHQRRIAVNYSCRPIYVVGEPDQLTWSVCNDVLPPLRRDGDEPPRCAVVVRDAPCDPAAGRELAPDGTCRVRHLTSAEDLARCEDADLACEGCTPGWCLPRATRACPTPFVRLTGNALPPGASADVICELSARQ